VRTSIGRADSILEGTSYYRAEVEAMGELLARRGAEPALVLIDELFRGTNSVERVAAAKAVLEALDRGDDLIIVATHDVELLAMLPGYASFHFREEVRDGALHFDYRLHDGPSSTRNALAILELAGYPAEVVAEARRLAEERDGDRAASVAIPV
jgi:DNA mismatch repair ATPase MutS